MGVAGAATLGGSGAGTAFAAGAAPVALAAPVASAAPAVAAAAATAAIMQLNFDGIILHREEKSWTYFSFRIW